MALNISTKCWTYLRPFCDLPQQFLFGDNFSIREFGWRTVKRREDWRCSGGLGMWYGRVEEHRTDCGIEWLLVLKILRRDVDEGRSKRNWRRCRFDGRWLELWNTVRRMFQDLNFVGVATGVVLKRKRNEGARYRNRRGGCTLAYQLGWVWVAHCLYWKRCTLACKLYS